MAVELAEGNLKYKYRIFKPWGRYRANYMGNSGSSMHKHSSHPDIHGIKRMRKRTRGKRY